MIKIAKLTEFDRKRYRELTAGYTSSEKYMVWKKVVIENSPVVDFCQNIIVMAAKKMSGFAHFKCHIRIFYALSIKDTILSIFKIGWSYFFPVQTSKGIRREMTGFIPY